MNSPRLLELAILRSPEGTLEFPRRSFGDFLTVLRGPNGSGKTAVMCSLFWALGGSRRPEEPLWSQCSGVQLVLRSADGQRTTIVRHFTSSLQAFIEVDGDRRSFEKETDFGYALREVLRIPHREWTGKSGGVVAPYMSVVLPAFAIDQDIGWGMPYAPFGGANFVKDQEEEVGRLFMGLEPRHNAARDEVRRKLLEQRDTLRETLQVRTRAIDALTSEIGREEGRRLGELRATRAQLEIELVSFDSLVTAFVEADAGMSARIEDARLERDDASRSLSHAQQRLSALERLMQETDGDLDVVGSNETAAQAFRSFCGNPACEFFSGAAENPTYGRRILYLRDQLKDLRTAMKSAGGQVELHQRRFATADARLKRLRQEYENLSRASPAARITGTMDAVTRELARVTSGIAIGEEIASAETARAELLRETEAVEQAIADHDAATKRSTTQVGQVRAELEGALDRWLKVLRTNPIGDVGIGSDLRVTIDGELLTDRRGPSGSSRTRLVLAFHAARLEVALSRQTCHPGMLLFDSPKQHEIDPGDFESYIEELRSLAGQYRDRVQVVASSRTRIPLTDDDSEWLPSFPSRESDQHPWFLGVPDQPGAASVGSKDD